AEVTLYVHHNPGEDVSRAISLAGKPYTELPTAFQYRKEFVASCSCRRPGESWAQALRGTDNRGTIETGDILVDDQRAKLMSLPKLDAQGRPIKVDPRGAKVEPKAQTPNQTTSAVEGSETPDPKRPVRSVGPTFLPGR